MFKDLNKTEIAKGFSSRKFQLNSFLAKDWEIAQLKSIIDKIQVVRKNRSTINETKNFGGQFVVNKIKQKG